MATSIGGTTAAPVIEKPTTSETPSASASSPVPATSSTLSQAPESHTKTLTDTQKEFRAKLADADPYDVDVAVKDHAKEPLTTSATKNGCVTATCYTTCGHTCVTC